MARRGVALLALMIVACASGNLVVNSNTNECMNVPYHGYPQDGTQVRLLQCMGRDNQYWTVTPTGQITGVGGSCLDIQGSEPVDGARILFVTCNGRPSQNWKLSNGMIVGMSGKCIDVAGGGPNDHAPLILVPCNGAPSQQWSLH
jgi:Ricin-type beta-trefoil lectin domain